MVDWFIHGFESDRYAQELSDAIKATGNKIHLLKLPPFSVELPDPPSVPFVLYGGTRIIEAAAVTKGWQSGVWYNAETFKWHKNYLGWYGKMLMHKVYLTNFNHIHFSLYKDSDRVFVRPDSDLKEFAGEVMTMGELKEWRDKLIAIDDEPGLIMNSHTPIILGDVVDIVREWRVFIVDSVPVDCSRYRSSGRFDPAREFPNEVREFVNEICDIYLPSPVIVIDVGVDDKERFGVIEANCFNSSGWYDVDIEMVVDAVSKYQLKGK